MDKNQFKSIPKSETSSSPNTNSLVDRNYLKDLLVDQRSGSKTPEIGSSSTKSCDDNVSGITLSSMLATAPTIDQYATSQGRIPRRRLFGSGPTESQSSSELGPQTNLHNGFFKTRLPNRVSLRVELGSCSTSKWKGAGKHSYAVEEELSNDYVLRKIKETLGVDDSEEMSGVGGLISIVPPITSETFRISNGNMVPEPMDMDFPGGQ